MLAYVLVTITRMEIILFLERRRDSVSLVMPVITVFFFVSKKKARNIAALLRRRYHPSHNQRRGSYLSGTTPVLHCVAVLMAMQYSSRHRRRYRNCY